MTSQRRVARVKRTIRSSSPYISWTNTVNHLSLAHKRGSVFFCFFLKDEKNLPPFHPSSFSIAVLFQEFPIVGQSGACFALARDIHGDSQGVRQEHEKWMNEWMTVEKKRTKWWGEKKGGGDPEMQSTMRWLAFMNCWSMVSLFSWHSCLLLETLTWYINRDEVGEKERQAHLFDLLFLVSSLSAR